LRSRSRDHRCANSAQMPTQSDPERDRMADGWVRSVPL